MNYFLRRLMMSSRFTKNIGWIGMTEILSRVSRLTTVIVLAHFLSLSDYGAAAIALTANELIKVLTNTGVGQRIIQVDEAHLSAVCNTAWRMNWVICIGLFLLQSAIAPFVAWFYDAPALTWMIVALAGVYLMMPIGLVQCFLIQRQGQMKPLAVTATVQMTLDNILTALFAALGWGAWAVVLPKLLVGPVWVIGMLRAYHWQSDPVAGQADWREILSFGRSVLGVETLKTLRLHADRLILGAALGVEVVGLYFFAFSAGLGLSMAFVTSFGSALFPHLCEVKNDVAGLRERWFGALKLAAKVAVPVMILQAVLAPWYVPIVYGERWHEAIPALAILCLSAIPRPFAEAASQLMRARGRPDLDFWWNILFTLVYLAGVSVAVRWGIWGVVITVLGVHWLIMPYMTVWTALHVLPATPRES
ncbi:MAG: lipopolysaccharide biosynthesis protein [Pseudomonadota bacterium]